MILMHQRKKNKIQDLKPMGQVDNNGNYNKIRNNI